MAVAAIISTAYGAAAPYESVVVFSQTRIASVSVPIGASRRVAVSSVETVRKTSIAAAAKPGAIKGRVILAKTQAGRAPSVRAASSSEIGTRAMAARVATSASGRV